VTTQQIVPIDMILTVDPRGLTSAAGDLVTITGTITCSRTANLNIGVNVTQLHTKRFVAITSGTPDLFTCGPTTQRWTAVMGDAGPIRFGSGAAIVDANAGSSDDHGSGFADSLGNAVKLKY